MQSRAILYRLLFPKNAPGISKIVKILRTVVKSQGFAIFRSDHFLGSILDPFGLPICSQDGPQSSQNASKTPPRPPQERPRHAQERPRAFQERSRCLQDSPKSARDAPKSAQDAFKRAPEPSKTQLAAQTAVQPLSRQQLQTCAPPTTLPTTKVCGGTREASYNPPHTFRCA